MLTTNFITKAARSPSRLARLSQEVRSNRQLFLGCGILILLALACFVGPIASPVDPNAVAPIRRLEPISVEHPFGTDQFGRDVLARFLHGGQISLVVGLISASAATVFGVIVGILAGYVRWLDQLLMRISDGLLAIPGVLLAIGLMASLGPATSNVILAMSIVSTPIMARLVRSRVISVKQETYMEAIRLQRPNFFRVVGMHVMPNILTTIVVQATFIFADTVIAEATLSFLGAGVPAPDASWGNMLADGKTLLFVAWWVAVFPAIGLIVAVVALNLAGDGLRDRLDPKIMRSLR